MGQAITTNVAPAVRKYTNIPSKVSEEPGGYQFHELGPRGEVIDDPEQFAQIQSQTPKPSDMSFFDFQAKVKADMGDPYLINVDQEATLLMNQQEREIFNRWSGGQYQYGGYMPKEAQKKWGMYKQKLLANAQKVAGAKKAEQVSAYEHLLADFKIARTAQLDVAQEKRLGRQGADNVVKGGLTEEQAIDQIKVITMTDEDARIGTMQYLKSMQGKEDNPAGRRAALKETITYLEKMEAGTLTPEDKDQLKATHGGDYKYKPASEVTAPEGYVDTGKTQNGKKVYQKMGASPGQKFWVQP